MSIKEVESTDSCRVCYEDAAIMGISICNHPICAECVLKMKYLVNQLVCPICRDPLKHVILDYSHIKKYNEYDLDQLIEFNTDDIFCSSVEIKNILESVISYKCSSCDMTLSNEFQLRAHASEIHQKYFCDLCIQNLHFFPKDYKQYTKHELVAHTWDKNNGHPLCSLCDNRFYNDDQLILHLRREHICCYICEKNGKNVYFLSSEKLREHAQNQHFICSIDSCGFSDSINIFENEQEFQNHKILYHFNQLTSEDYDKIQPQVGFGSRKKSDRRRYFHPETEACAVEHTQPLQNKNTNLAIDDLNSFPSLTGKKSASTIDASPSIPKNQPKPKNISKMIPRKTYEDNFPLLEGAVPIVTNKPVQWGSTPPQKNNSTNSQGTSSLAQTYLNNNNTVNKTQETTPRAPIVINTKRHDEFPSIVESVKSKKPMKDKKPKPTSTNPKPQPKNNNNPEESKLIKLVRSACQHDATKFQKFIEISGRYYRREITANSYRNHGISIFGRSQIMDDLIPSLVETLDDDLKNNLIEVKQRKNKETS